MAWPMIPRKDAAGGSRSRPCAILGRRHFSRPGLHLRQAFDTDGAGYESAPPRRLLVVQPSSPTSAARSSPGPRRCPTGLPAGGRPRGIPQDNARAASQVPPPLLLHARSEQRFGALPVTAEGHGGCGPAFGPRRRTPARPRYAGDRRGGTGTATGIPGALSLASTNAWIFPMCSSVRWANRFCSAMYSRTGLYSRGLCWYLYSPSSHSYYPRSHRRPPSR
jgi:hypothetical protein